MWFFVSLFIASTVAAVFIRVAYALTIELVVLLTGVLMSRRLVRRQWLALAGAAAGPVIAVALLSAANSVVFGDRFQHEPFINKLSGVFLASIFAPALQMSDFEAAGIPLTATEFQRLDVTNYDRRLGHAWAQSPDYLHQLIKDRLGVTEDYTTEVDSTAARLVWSAFKRNPIAVARVYAWGAWQYFRMACRSRCRPGTLASAAGKLRGFLQSILHLEDRFRDNQDPLAARALLRRDVVLLPSPASDGLGSSRVPDDCAGHETIHCRACCRLDCRRGDRAPA